MPRKPAVTGSQTTSMDTVRSSPGGRDYHRSNCNRLLRVGVPNSEGVIGCAVSDESGTYGLCHQSITELKPHPTAIMTLPPGEVINGEREDFKMVVIPSCGVKARRLRRIHAEVEYKSTKHNFVDLPQTRSSVAKREILCL